jgi:hypothetical protein
MLHRAGSLAGILRLYLAPGALGVAQDDKGKVLFPWQTIRCSPSKTDCRVRVSWWPQQTDERGL